MAQRIAAPRSRYAQEAIRLLGSLVRAARLERKLTAQDVADRAGMSRALLHRIERGDPGCAIGAVFEAAAIVGVPLFQAEGRPGIEARQRRLDRDLTLLPKASRGSRKAVSDDF